MYVRHFVQLDEVARHRDARQHGQHLDDHRHGG